jgi:CheY-like chemotaxis protein
MKLSTLISQRKKRKNRILLVEDENIVAKDIKNMLMELGYLVCGPVSSGPEAIKSVKEKNPSLVLMDIKLKGEMDGIEASKRIHKIINIPIIYMTSYTDDQTFNRAKRTNHQGYLVKPLEKFEIKDVIDQAIKNTR